MTQAVRGAASRLASWKARGMEWNLRRRMGRVENWQDKVMLSVFQRWFAP